MRLVNVLALTNAKLVNEPFISNFSNIVFEAKAVKRGDLFIAFDDETIEDAVLNGAYGVIFDKPTQISDNEIAWIKVDSIDEALTKLLRFRLIEKEISAYKTDEIILKLASQISTESTFVVVNGDIKSISNKLWNIDSKSTVLFCPTLCDKKIFTDVKEIQNSDNSSNITIVEQTLFETSFIYEEIFYERQLISPLFIPSLQKLLNLYKSLKINYRLKKFTQIDNFKARFVNNNFHIKEFGTTEKVVIFEKDIALFDIEREFLEKNANWSKIIYILDSSHIEKYKNSLNIYFYKKNSEILSILKKYSFHFALVVSEDNNILNITDTKQIQLTLDF